MSDFKKRLIMEEKDTYGIKFYLEEYYGSEYGENIIGGKEVKRLKINIDCTNINEAINFLQEYKKEVN